MQEVTNERASVSLEQNSTRQAILDFVAVVTTPPTLTSLCLALADKDLRLVGIVIEPTEDMRRLQQRVIDAIAPFAVEQGTGEAFAPRLDGGAIGQPTVDYVNNFVGPRTGVNYHPHLTVGIGASNFVDALKAEPFEAFTVRAVSVSLYQLGDYGVAQRKLYELHRC